MNNKKTSAKLQLNKQTLLKLEELASVQGGADAQGLDVVITKKEVAAAGSWVACCR